MIKEGSRHPTTIVLIIFSLLITVNLAKRERIKIYKNEIEKQFSFSISVLREEIVRSHLECATICLNNELCCSVSYQTPARKCRLTSDCRQNYEVAGDWSVIRKLLSGPHECRRSEMGYEYVGKIHVTSENLQCQRWDASFPHVPAYDTTTYSVINIDENYCRNPDIHALPWCYTTDPNTRTESCEIPYCDTAPKQCLESTSGIEYFGHINISRSGKPCLRWDKSPYAPGDFSQTFGYLRDEENYCRNPYGKELSPFCYVTNSDLEACDIPSC